MGLLKLLGLKVDHPKIVYRPREEGVIEVEIFYESGKEKVHPVKLGVFSADFMKDFYGN